VITHYDDLPFDHSAFAAFQWLGARGLNLGYRAQPELKLTRRGGWERLSRVLQAEQRPWKQPSDAPDAPLLGKDVAQWLGEAGLPTDDAELQTLGDRELQLAQFVTLVYHAFQSAEARAR
jgi:hypothetical protein